MENCILYHLRRHFWFRRVLLYATFILAISIPVVASGAQSKEPSGNLSVYTAWNEQDMNKLEVAFNKVYPNIKVTSVRSEGHRGGLLERLLTEISSGKYFGDVYNTGTVDMAVMAKRGLLAPYKSPSEANIDPRFRSEDGGLTHPNCLLVFMSAYNKNLLRKNELPTSWDELLQPKWKGKIAIPQDPNDISAGFIIKMGQEKAFNYLRELAKNVVIRNTMIVCLELLSTGELPLALSVYAHRVAGFQKDGAPIDAVPLPHYVASPNLQGIIKNAPNLENAKLWIDWMMSPDGQEVVASLNRGTVGRTKGAKDPQGHLLEGRELVVLNVKTMPLDFTELTKKTREIFIMSK